ncbi:MAG: pyridoxal phosphate-dependent aminotransferase [Solirubrobacterales bacterium]|nr:pyridoxal phosphate-dependent aminotransferase [Solirubrobacterales bacterium]
MTRTPKRISPTLWIDHETARRQAAGLPTVPLGFGEARVPVLPDLANRMAEAADRAEYGPVAGVPALRDAAAGYWQRRGIPAETELVIAGPGTKPLLYALLHAIGGPIAIPRPSWVSYAAQAALIGIAAVPVPVPPGTGGIPIAPQLDAAAQRARAAGAPLRAVILTLPDNPTGSHASPEDVLQVCDVAERHDLLLICDEIYRDLIHDPDAHLLSPGEVAPNRTVVTTGLSKNLALGGWRIGVARFPHNTRGRTLRDRVLSVASEVWSAPAHPVQLAAAWAFTEPAQVRDRIAASRRLHAAVARATSHLLARHDIAHRRPAAGFYLYPNFDAHRDRLTGVRVSTSADLAALLLERYGIATLPGTAFGENDHRLTLRLATSGLYGTSAEQLSALEHPNPAKLPWIERSLQALDRALADLIGPPSVHVDKKSPAQTAAGP